MNVSASLTVNVLGKPESRRRFVAGGNYGKGIGVPVVRGQPVLQSSAPE